MTRFNQKQFITQIITNHLQENGILIDANSLNNDDLYKKFRHKKSLSNLDLNLEDSKTCFIFLNFSEDKLDSTMEVVSDLFYKFAEEYFSSIFYREKIQEIHNVMLKDTKSNASYDDNSYFPITFDDLVKYWTDPSKKTDILFYNNLQLVFENRIPLQTFKNTESAERYFSKNIEELSSRKNKDTFSKGNLDKSELKLYLVFISKEEPKVLSNIKSIRKLRAKIQREIKKGTKHQNSFIYAHKIKISYEPIPLNIDKRDFQLGIDNRVNSLNYRYDNNLPEINNDLPKINNDPPEINSVIFNVNLFDLVNLYTSWGTILFNHNVRVNISSNEEVEESIKNTLENDPDSFWLRNNGVTLIIKKNDSKEQNPVPQIDKRFVNKITLRSNKLGDISVINGAQTLSAAKKFFSDGDISELIIENAKNKAFVMLRIIEIPNDDIQEQRNDPSRDTRSTHLGTGENAINELAVSLNRQKPVRFEDIAYTLPVIQDMQALYYQYKDQKNSALNPYVFNIVRRGESELIAEQSYSLKSLSKILYLLFENKPGETRSISYDALLEITTVGETQGLKKNLFPNSRELNNTLRKLEVTPNDETLQTKLENDFLEFYKPVNFSMLLNWSLSNDSYDLESLTVKDIKNILNKITDFTTDEEKLAQLSEENLKKFNEFSHYVITYATVVALSISYPPQDKEISISFNNLIENLSENLKNFDDLGLLDSERVSSARVSSAFKKVYAILFYKWSTDIGVFDGNTFRKDNLIRGLFTPTLYAALKSSLEDETDL